MEDILQFLAIAEKLKTTLRHSWTNDSGRQESVAEHSWMICLVAMLLFEKIAIPLDRTKVLKMLIIHDLGEAITGDIPLSHQQGSFDRATKLEAERSAMQEMLQNLSPETKKELMDLWEESEARETIESKFAKSIDVVEACIQHWISDITTWDEGDYKVCAYHKEELFKIDPFMAEFKDFVDAKTMKKIVEAGKTASVDGDKLEKYSSGKYGNS